MVDGAWLQKVPDLVLRLHGHPSVDGTLGTALRVVVKVVKPRKTHHRAPFLFSSIVIKTRCSQSDQTSKKHTTGLHSSSPLSLLRLVLFILSTSVPSLIGRFYTFQLSFSSIFDWSLLCNISTVFQFCL